MVLSVLFGIKPDTWETWLFVCRVVLNTVLSTQQNPHSGASQSNMSVEDEPAIAPYFLEARWAVWVNGSLQTCCAEKSGRGPKVLCCSLSCVHTGLAAHVRWGQRTTCEVDAFLPSLWVQGTKLRCPVSIFYPLSCLVQRMFSCLMFSACMLFKFPWVVNS